MLKVFDALLPNLNSLSQKGLTKITGRWKNHALIQSKSLIISFRDKKPPHQHDKQWKILYSLEAGGDLKHHEGIWVDHICSNGLVKKIEMRWDRNSDKGISISC